MLAAVNDKRRALVVVVVVFIIALCSSRIAVHCGMVFVNPDAVVIFDPAISVPTHVLQGNIIRPKARHGAALVVPTASGIASGARNGCARSLIRRVEAFNAKRSEEGSDRGQAGRDDGDTWLY